jgi:hypothetical protein
MASTPGKCRYCHRPISAGRRGDALFSSPQHKVAFHARPRKYDRRKAAEQVNPLAGYG